MSGHVFISYARTNRAYVEQLASHLRNSGLAVWFDKDLAPGDRWDRKIQAEIDPCAAFVVVMTSAAGNSDWVDREIIRAEQLGKPIFPLLLDGQHFFRLANLQFEDVRDGRLPSREFVSRLAAVTGGGSAPAAQHAAIEPGTNRRELVARSWFLSRLKPSLRIPGKGQSGYDAQPVQQILGTLRTLAAQDMTRFQAFLATAPRRFPETKGRGYASLSVSVFLNDVDRAMDQYLKDVADWPSLTTTDDDFRSGTEAARRRLFSRLKADFRMAGRSEPAYDIQTVNQFLETMRELTAEDMMRFQAFIAFTPNRFPEIKGKGYASLSVDVFMNSLNAVAREYAENLAAAGGFRLD